MATKQKLTAEEKHPELYRPSTQIDRRQCKRVVPMQVLNLGMPRTGTMSIQGALNTLGYNCYHSVNFFSNIPDTYMWNEAMDAKFLGRGPRFSRTEWDQLLGDYSAVSADPPAVAFAEDLIEAYPDAKVIVVEREIESWFTSFDKNVIEAQWSPLINFVCDIDPFFMGPIKKCHRGWATGWMDSHNRKEMQEKSRQKYRDHYALVRRVTPPERLLEYKLGDGWGPLCRFLGKPVPDEPFPRVNDSEAMQELLVGLMKRSLYGQLVRFMKFVLPVLVMGAAVWFNYRRN